ncbi:MAG: hypothetical protein M1832_004965 [Thelocarpon impressellum]|nr:MAG: hypothetical protein M1832_004965 [Thelocarpon impressellum]
MTMSTPRAVAGATLRTSGFTTRRQLAREPPPVRRYASGFLQFWYTDATRNAFLSAVPSDDLLSFRLACHDFGIRAAPFLFADLTITFRSSTFTRPTRMAALERIGPHVRTLTFRMPHNSETFLPPLLDPITGEERVFHYVPQVRSPASFAARIMDPKYGSWEMTDLLIKQYGPLFHAATNVPAFVRALSAMSGAVHIRISCPGQAPSQRYRRSVVDYALISLRIAVEQAPLLSLSTLSLLPIHPGALLYLRPAPAIGGSPKGCRRWAQVKKLAVHMDSWAFDVPGAPTDHLKLLHDYLGSFSTNVERLAFRWKGGKGPCPLIRPSEPRSTSRPAKRSSRRLHFASLRHVELSNVHLRASQVSRFIGRHRRTMRDCDFQDVALDDGDWDEALAVLTRLSGSDRWKEEQVVEAPPRKGAPRLRGGEWFGSQEHMNQFIRNSTLISTC